MTLSVCDWKHGKKWVYSIPYAEGLVALHRFVSPHHEACGIPGHVEVVASQLGEIRKIGQSSYNGMRHMNGDELKDLLQRGGTLFPVLVSNSSFVRHRRCSGRSMYLSPAIGTCSPCKTHVGGMHTRHAHAAKQSDGVRDL